MNNYSRKEDIALVDPGKMSKVFTGNSLIEIITTEHPAGRISNYRKLKGGKYLNTKTGEIKECKKSSTQRFDKEQNLKKSYTNLRRLIDYNFRCIPSEKHIVLTYKENVREYFTVCSDFKNFWARFIYKYPSCEYIRIIEPHQSGRWHIHLLVKQRTSRPLFIPVAILTEIWGHGAARIFSLPESANFCLYFSAYPRSGNDISKELIDNAMGIKKSMEKYERLKYYPQNYRVYSYSRGIHKPVPLAMTHEQALALANNSKPCFGYTNRIYLQDDLGNEREVNAITYEQYKVKN